MSNTTKPLHAGHKAASTTFCSVSWRRLTIAAFLGFLHQYSHADTLGWTPDELGEVVKKEKIQVWKTIAHDLNQTNMTSMYASLPLDVRQRAYWYLLQIFSGLLKNSKKQEFIRTGKDMERQARAYVEWVKPQIRRLNAVIVGDEKFDAIDDPDLNPQEIFAIGDGVNPKSLLGVMQKRLRRARGLIFDGIVAQNENDRALRYFEEQAKFNDTRLDAFACDRWLRALCNDEAPQWNAGFIESKMKGGGIGKSRWSEFRSYLKSLESIEKDDEARDLVTKTHIFEEAFENIFPMSIGAGPNKKQETRKTPVRKP